MCALAFMGLATAQVPAQPAEVRLTRNVCAGCTVELQPLVRLLDTHGQTSFGDRAIVARDDRGRFYVESQVDMGMLAVYDPAGRFISRVGRRGGGPGEYRGVLHVASRGADSLYVYDGLAGRITVLGPDHAVGRTIPAPAGPQPWIVFDDGAFLRSGALRTERSAGFPLHLYDADGAWRASFGADNATILPDQGLRQQRVLSRSDDNSFWAAPINYYRFEHWHRDGTQLRVLIGDPPWMRQGWSDNNYLYERPPGTIAAIRQEGQYLWVLALVAAPGWTAFTGGRGEQLPAREAADAHDARVDSLMEVIDLRQNRVVASTRFAEVVSPVRNSTAVFRVRYSPEGVPVIQIWQPVLRT